MNVFIDTNVYLTFYHLSNENLDELEKAFVLQRSRKITIWLPEQVVDEYKRNREVKIADALKRFRDDKLNEQIPQFVKGYPDHDKLIKAKKSFYKAKNAILESLKLDIANKTLKADKIISEIFQTANRVEINEEMLQKAKRRFDKGNPPGKNSSYGDAINWECLLKKIPVGEELHLVADDGDYFSPINENEINQFLFDEWQSQKHSDVFIYRRLSQFAAKYFPGFIRASELEKELLIKDLEKSGSFSETHRIINRLSKVDSFTPSEVNEIVKAYINNSQISWIILDDDVKEFAEMLLARYEGVIDEEKLYMMNNLLLIEEDPFDMF